MKKLLLNSGLLLLIGSLTFCGSNKINTNESDSAKSEQGSSVSSQSSDTIGGKEIPYKKVRIEHNSPDQSKIDKIKKRKNKNKK